MMKKIVFGIIFMLAAFSVAGEEFMLYGDSYVANIVLPDYWAVNMDMAKAYNLSGFFFLEDEGIENSSAAIVVSLATKPNEKSKLQDYIDYDMAVLKNSYPNMIFKPFKISKPNKYGHECKVFEFYNKPGGRHQYIAYFDGHPNYMLKMYIDFVEKKKEKKYRKDFLTAVHKLSYMNADVKEKK
ncbi:MAG: hypothetical protein CR988_05780 [Treponema sp.]|nr:MAG: hypothetical protein CR988_05780 [Treponema sp.]